MYQTQNYGYQQPYPVSRPTYQGNAMPYPGIKGRPVASFEEARASMIDFDGSVFYFANMANKRIYTKQINLDGTVNINLYEQKILSSDQSTESFVTRQEFESVISQLKDMVVAKPQQVVTEEKYENVEQTAAQTKPQFSF